MGLFFAKQYMSFYPVEAKVTKVISSTSRVEEESVKTSESKGCEPDALDRINESPPDPTDI